MQYFIKQFEKSIKTRWNQAALDEFRTSSLTYGELAAKVVENHLFFEAVGLDRGDKVSINARSSAQWAEIFMSVVSGGYVAVQLFNGYTPSDTQSLVHHSDSRILYTEKQIFSNMDFEAMPQVMGVIDLKSGELPEETSQRSMPPSPGCSPVNILPVSLRTMSTSSTGIWTSSARSTTLPDRQETLRA